MNLCWRCIFCHRVSLGTYLFLFSQLFSETESARKSKCNFLCYLYNRFSELRKDIRQSASRLASESKLEFWNMYICSTFLIGLQSKLSNKIRKAFRADKLVLTMVLQHFYISSIRSSNLFNNR